MRHFLVGDPTGIDDGAKTVGRSLLAREPAGQHHDLAERRLIAFADIVERRNVPLWNQHEMHGRLWVDVVKPEDFGVLVYLAARYLAAHDLAENAVRIVIHR